MASAYSPCPILRLILVDDDTKKACSANVVHCVGQSERQLQVLQRSKQRSVQRDLHRKGLEAANAYATEVSVVTRDFVDAS